MTAIDARLDSLRGGTAPLSFTARTIAALTANPGCARRALMDAAGAEKAALTTHAGLPHPAATTQPPVFLANRGLFEAPGNATGAAPPVPPLRGQPRPRRP